MYNVFVLQDIFFLICYYAHSSSDLTMRKRIGLACPDRHQRELKSLIWASLGIFSFRFLQEEPWRGMVGRNMGPVLREMKTNRHKSWVT